MAVDPDPADLGVDQPRDQADQRLLRVLVLAHDRGPRSGRELGRDPFEQDPARAALERHVLEADPVLERRQELRAAVLVKLGLPFEELEDGRGRAVRLTDRLPQRQPLPDRIHEARQGRHQHEHRRGRKASRHQRRVAEHPERQDRRGAEEQADGRVQPPFGLDPPRVGLAEPFQVLVEPLLVEVLHAVDADGPEQAEVFVEQAELDRRVAHGGVGDPAARRGASRATSSRPAPPSDSQEDRRGPARGTGR